MPETAAPKRPWLQFSMLRLMVAITLVAILLGVSVTFGDWIGAVFASILLSALTTPLIICAIFGRGDIQTFAIGALVPCLAYITNRPPWQSFPELVLLIVMGAICGAIGVATRRWVERNGYGGA